MSDHSKNMSVRVCQTLSIIHKKFNMKNRFSKRGQAESFYYKQLDSLKWECNEVTQDVLEWDWYDVTQFSQVRLRWGYTVFLSEIEMRLYRVFEWDWDEVTQCYWVRLRFGYTECSWVRLRCHYTIYSWVRKRWYYIECSSVRLRWGKTECSWVRLLWGSTECSWAFLWIMRLQWGVIECSGAYIRLPEVIFVLPSVCFPAGELACACWICWAAWVLKAFGNDAEKQTVKPCNLWIHSVW